MESCVQTVAIVRHDPVSLEIRYGTGNVVPMYLADVAWDEVAYRLIMRIMLRNEVFANFIVQVIFDPTEPLVDPTTGC